MLRVLFKGGSHLLMLSYIAGLFQGFTVITSQKKALLLKVIKIILIHSFTVGKIKLVFYEICFVKAFLQTLLYSAESTIVQYGTSVQNIVPVSPLQPGVDPRCQLLSWDGES